MVKYHIHSGILSLALIKGVPAIPILISQPSGASSLDSSPLYCMFHLPSGSWNVSVSSLLYSSELSLHILVFSPSGR